MLPTPEIDIRVPRILLLSLHPIYAKLFFERTKRVELRRTRPRLSEGDLVLFYVTAPEQAIGGGGRVRKVLELPPRDIWRSVGDIAGISKASFERYFEGCDFGYGILFDVVWPFEPTIRRSAIKQSWPEFRPPQLYHYLTESEVRRLGVRIDNGELALLRDRTFTS